MMEDLYLTILSSIITNIYKHQTNGERCFVSKLHDDILLLTWISTRG